MTKKILKQAPIWLGFWLIGFLMYLLSPKIVFPASSMKQLNYELTASSYLGGEFDDRGNQIAVGEDGSMYVVGLAQSTQFPTSTVSLSSHGEDAYIAKFSPDGTHLEYIFWFNADSGSAPDEAYGLAVDNAGGAYVTGRTRSSDFCTFFGDFPGYDTSYNGDGGDNDAFVFKINAEGTAVSYCTFLGGSNTDTGRSIAVDALGRATVTGGTWSSDFPVTADAYDDTITPDDRDIFVARLSASGTALEYATYIGGSSQEEAVSIVLDDQQNMYLTGWTFSTDFPTTPQAFDQSKNSGADGFVTQLAADGASLVYSSFLGGSLEDRATAVAVDSSGSAYVAGYTQSSDFPVITGSAQITHAGGHDGFVLKLTPSGDTLVYSTFLGGGSLGGSAIEQSDQIFALAVNEQDEATVVGETFTVDFPTTPLAFATDLLGESDLFITQLSADGSAWRYSTYVGGMGEDDGAGVAVRAGQIFVTGQTSSTDFPISDGAYNELNNGLGDAFVLAFDLVQEEVLTAVFNATANPANPRSIAFDNLSTGAYITSTWSFGDGMTSTVTNPTHQYAQAGTYTVTLTIANNSQTDSTQRTVLVPHLIYLPVMQKE